MSAATEQLHYAPAKASYSVKRMLDFLISLGVLVVFGPFIFLFTIFIILDGGPPIFAHERIGRNGKPFKCLKFRTMVVDSQERLQKVLETNPEARKEWEETQKLKNDPRVTWIGKFLRKTSLDEVPQFINVLKGEMSLVGPRPVIAAELEKYGSTQKYYLAVRPGLTGLWQISGRNNTTYEERIDFDRDYVSNWSLWRDIVILFKTPVILLTGYGAY